ncbi:MAG TPA: type II toxin-antitoxin system RatA family toxin [Gammaproteobacteria bacterium]|nr:type II toxin-antitoxin system RatA family toxin [Gammaproteobacteria bacterium]
MPVVRRKAIIPYTPSQIYSLVNDVSQYPNFLPWCNRVEILGHDHHYMKARVFITQGIFKYSFTTMNYLTPHDTVQMALVEGPFKSLKGLWQFKELNSGTEVSFFLDFEFASKWMELMLGPIFNQITDTMIGTFLKRAHELYG